PEINGLELIQRIRHSALCQGVKIIVVTGAGDRRLVKKSLDKAALDAVFFKPFHIEQLVDTAHALLQGESIQGYAL
ncbi:MAG: response regulator, partial [Mariprofundaceae bacterium]|nr:response regulator [Mariprofundaceae bacterium]